MKLTIRNKDKFIKLYGNIKSNGNKYYVEIEVPMEIHLDMVIANIKGFDNKLGNITLVNNYNVSIKSSASHPEMNLYVYQVGYVVTGHINETTIRIKEIDIYYRELDKFFISNRYIIDYENLDKEFSLKQKYNEEILLDTSKLQIKYYKYAYIKKDEFDQKILCTPVKLHVIFKEKIRMGDLFEELKKIEACLGFVINRKINLLELQIVDIQGTYHEVILSKQKNFRDVVLKDFNIVDVTSKGILKDIFKIYYNNECISSAVNMFYEYIYNDLDNIFEFTSLVNTLELVLATEFYLDRVKEYTIANNLQLQENNEIMMGLFDVISTKQKKFIKSFYRFDNVTLRDKIEYLFFEIFRLENNEKSQQYISSIISTRNHYVHGIKVTKKLTPVDMVGTVHLLKDMLYVVIVNCCTSERNLLIDTYALSIPSIYSTTIKYLK